MNKDNTIAFYDSKDTNKLIFSMQAPYMADAAGAKSTDIAVSLDKVDIDTTTGGAIYITTGGAIDTSIEKADNDPIMSEAGSDASKDEVDSYLLTITPNKQWLDELERVYPVTIDPTLKTDTTAPMGVYVYSAALIRIIILTVQHIK